MDDLIGNAPPSDAIKCDVAGAEKLLRTHRPWMICEMRSRLRWQSCPSNAEKRTLNHVAQTSIVRAPRLKTNRLKMKTDAQPIAPTKTWIAILGSKDFPTDGVQDYCEFLDSALQHRAVELRIIRVEWKQKGWLRALRELWRDSVDWRDKRVILQYTAMSWSRRGLPFAVLIVLALLRRRGARCAVMFHEPYPQRGSRHALARLRTTCQHWVIRAMHRRADKSIFPDSLGTIGWLPKGSKKAVFIPIGANIPEPVAGAAAGSEIGNTTRTVAIFCLTGAPHFHRELQEIAEAARAVVASGTKIRLLFFGRGTAEAREDIGHAICNMPVEFSILGLLPPAEITATLLKSDAMLCARGTVYPSRGSVIAGIACGLPIVGYRGPETVSPIAEAGLELVPYGQPGALGEALSRVLSDNHLWQQLRDRSLRAHANYFSWEKIAERFSTEFPNG